MLSERVAVLLVGIATLATVEFAHASYCGQSAIPFILEVQHDGQPRLGCARPSCFGWTAEGRRSADTAQFYRISGELDGFLRPDAYLQGPVLSRPAGFHPQYSPNYMSQQCNGSTWVGGIAPLASIDSETPMRLMCCSYNRLTEAMDTVRVELRAGQTALGGEMVDWHGQQYAFEYIANIQRLFDRNGVVYIATLKKFPCMPSSSSGNGVWPPQAAPPTPMNTMQFSSSNNNIRNSFATQKFDMPESAPPEEPPSKPLSPLVIHELRDGNSLGHPQAPRPVNKPRQVTVKDQDIVEADTLRVKEPAGDELHPQQLYPLHGLLYAPPSSNSKKRAVSGELHTREISSPAVDPEVIAVEALNRGIHVETWRPLSPLSR